MSRTPTHVWALVIATLGMLVAPPVIQAGRELALTGGLYALAVLRTLPTADALRDFETGLEERSWLVDWSRRRYGMVADRLLERGNRMVVFGHDRWLFHREAVDFVTGPDFSTARGRRSSGRSDQTPGPLTAVVDFHRQLADLGIDLIVVPVPVKATLYPERLSRSSPPAALPNNPGVGGFLEALDQRGIPVVDVTDALLELKESGTEAYLPRDTHWSPEGMGVAAQAIVDRVRTRAAFAELSDRTIRFDHRAVVFQGQGDIAGMLDYATWNDPFEPMQLELRQVIGTRRGRRPTGDDAAPVLLLGDSLTNVFSSPELQMGQRGGLAEQIADGLGLTVDVIASPGAGAARSRQSLALRPHGLAGKRIVIWQFTQRDLLFSRDGWPMVDLTAAAAEAPTGVDDVPLELTTRARVAAVSGTSDAPAYADCLMIVRYDYLDGDRPGGADQFWVAYWGWQDWERTTAASYRTGDVHTLTLRRMSADRTLENTCWVDSTGLSEPPWWVDPVDISQTAGIR